MSQFALSSAAVGTPGASARSKRPRAATVASSPSRTFSPAMADLFKVKYTRIELDIEQEVRLLHQLESELVRVKDAYARTMKDAHNASRLYEERAREHDRAEKRFHSLRRELDGVNRQIVRAREEKVQVAVLVERQQEQSVASEGNFTRYASAINDLRRKVDELTVVRDKALATNSALCGEIRSKDAAANSLELANVELNAELEKFRDILTSK